MGRKQHTRNATGPQGPSQRQLRAGELIRHALVEVLREEEIHDPAMEGVSVTVTDVRLSPDLRFRHDESFDAASAMDRLFNDPRVRADIEHRDDEDA